MQHLNHLSPEKTTADYWMGMWPHVSNCCCSRLPTTCQHMQSAHQVLTDPCRLSDIKKCFDRVFISIEFSGISYSYIELHTSESILLQSKSYYYGSFLCKCFHFIAIKSSKAKALAKFRWISRLQLVVLTVCTLDRNYLYFPTSF